MFPSVHYCICARRYKTEHIRWCASATIAALGLGYGMWSMISPAEEKRKELIKDLPESNPLRMEETRKRNALVMQALKEAAETNENIARGFGASKK